MPLQRKLINPSKVREVFGKWRYWRHVARVAWTTLLVGPVCVPMGLADLQWFPAVIKNQTVEKRSKKYSIESKFVRRDAKETLEKPGHLSENRGINQGQD